MELFDPTININVIKQLFVNRYRVDNSEVIYHYTSIESLIKILESNVIFGTELDFSNDRNEISYTLDLFTDYCNCIKSTDSDFAELFMGSIHNVKSSKYLSNIYITCFSRIADNLNLWKSSYTNNGKGVCVKFNQSRFLSILPSPIEYFDIIYKRDIQLQLLDEIAKYLKNSIQGLEHEIASNLISNYLFYVMTIFKHHDWNPENEFRIVAISKDCNWFNIYENVLNSSIPYTVFPIIIDNISIIEEIIVGPCSDSFENDRNKLEEVISNKHYRNQIIIRKSESPYRGK